MAENESIAVPMFDDAGRSVDCRFTCEADVDGWRISIASRGGTLGSSSARNSEYALGFRLLLLRLAALRLTLRDAYLDTRDPEVSALPIEQRRLSGDGVNFPVAMGPSTDCSALESSLRSAQTRIGSKRARGGGNSTRRVTFVITRSHDTASFSDLTDVLSGAATLGTVSDEDLADATGRLPDFDPSSTTDARAKTLAAIALRQGQPRFRKALLRAYDGRCAISGCDLEEALEAAHILPYRGEYTHHVQNGILLRADLHTLLDRGLISIDPDSLTVVIHPKLKHSQYAALGGTKLHLPASPSERPSSEALRKHRSGLSPS